MTNIESFKQALKAAKRDERHHTVAETRYWLEQYRMLAYQAVDALEQSEKQEPVAFYWEPSDDVVLAKHWTADKPPEGWTPLYTTLPAAQRTEPAQPVTGEKIYLDDGPEWNSRFEAWWTAHGQFCRAGGGDYEKTFAFRAYEAALATPPAAQQESVADDFFRMIADRNPKPFPLPQRTWVGLTDEERGQVYADWRFNGGNLSNLELCRAIEAKLKEKNNG
jgi:hypothetical protein